MSTPVYLRRTTSAPSLAPPPNPGYELAEAPHAHPTHRRPALLTSSRASHATPSGPQLRLAQESSLLGTLQGSLSDAARQGYRRTAARLVPLVSARADKIAALTTETGLGALDLKSDEELRAELHRLQEKHAELGGG